jgi:hypothetical protein
MKKDKKEFWEMDADELAAATAEFDDPNHAPRAVEPTAAQRAQLRRWQRRRSAARARIALSLDRRLIERTDSYAADHGVTFADVVTEALTGLMGRR